MLIKQKRICSEKYFATAVENKPVYIKVTNVSRYADKLKIFGFDDTIETGCCILPNNFNKASAKNAEAYSTVNRALPKEKYTQTIYWTRQEWAGRNQTREVSDFVFIPRKRYHRDWHPPYSVYFTYVKGAEPYIISDGIIYNKGNIDKLLNTVNMVLGLFGECDIEFPYQVPENNYFVMGDQRETSIDSRSSVIGCIPEDQLIGRIFCRILPLRDFEFVD